LVHLAQSCTKADRFKSTGLRICRLIFRFENARKRGRAKLAAALEIDCRADLPSLAVFPCTAHPLAAVRLGRRTLHEPHAANPKSCCSGQLLLGRSSEASRSSRLTHTRLFSLRRTNLLFPRWSYSSQNTPGPSPFCRARLLRRAAPLLQWPGGTFSRFSASAPPLMDSCPPSRQPRRLGPLQNHVHSVLEFQRKLFHLADQKTCFLANHPTCKCI
jgi:hypothetical protein